MNERMLQYWNNIKQYWNKFNRTSKILIAGIFFVFLVAIIFIIYSNSKTEYATAFTDLQPNDAASITQYLSDSGIPYKISNDGKTIGVPRNMVSQVKVDVVGQGLTQSGSIGWGVFRENSIFGKTEAQTRIMEMEALQGELEQLINTNVAVSGSKVLVTQQDDGVFANSTVPPTASVVVNLKPGYLLDSQKIDTMYLLISKSVPNLTVDNITISDQDGDLLPYSKSDPAQSGGANQAAAQQFQIKREFEEELRKEIIKLLAPIVGGTDKVVPMVVATLNYDKKTQQSDLVTPVNGESGIVVSSQENESSTTDNPDGGVAGTGTTDVPTYPADSGSGTSTSEESSRIFNYEFNRIREEIEAQPFYVNDLTISIGLDNTAVNTDLRNELKNNISTILRSLVSTSLANNGRAYTDEELAAKVMVLDGTFVTAAANNAEGTGFNWLLYGGIGAVAAVLAALGGFLVASRRRRNAEEEYYDEEGEYDEAPAVEFPSIDLENLTNDNQARKQLEQLAKKKPDEFVNLLRTWLVDE